MENPPMLFLDLDIATWVSSILVFGGLPKGIQWVGVKTLHLLLIFPGDSPKGPVVLPRDRPLRGTCPCGCGWSGNGNHHLKFFLDRSWTPPKKWLSRGVTRNQTREAWGSLWIYWSTKFQGSHWWDIPPYLEYLPWNQVDHQPTLLREIRVFLFFYLLSCYQI
jgi:hypothetical protein